jgi:hypothetical protein
MEKKLHSEMVNSQVKKMTKILFIATLVLGYVNISAQMKYSLNQIAAYTSTTAVPGDFDLYFEGSKEYEVNLLDVVALRIKGKKSPSWGEVLGETATVTFDGGESDIPTIFDAVITKGPDDVTWNDRNTNTVLYFDTGDTNNGILGQAVEVYLAVNFIKDGKTDYISNDAYNGWIHLTITDVENLSRGLYILKIVGQELVKLLTAKLLF